MTQPSIFFSQNSFVDHCGSRRASDRSYRHGQATRSRVSSRVSSSLSSKQATVLSTRSPISGVRTKRREIPQYCSATTMLGDYRVIAEPARTSKQSHPSPHTQFTDGFALPSFLIIGSADSQRRPSSTLDATRLVMRSHVKC